MSFLVSNIKQVIANHLIFASTKDYDENGDALHVVCGSDGTQLWMITTYKPDLTKWDNEAWESRRT